MRLLAVTLTLMIGALILLQSSAADAKPQVTFVFPAEGDKLAEPPQIIHMCFASPVNTKDLDKGGNFSFSVAMPDGRGLGLRIVFQPDGYGLEVHPGLPGDPPEGQWTFKWRVTDPETLAPATGTVNFTVSPEGSPLPEEPLSRCAPGGEPPTFKTPTSAAAEKDGGDEDTSPLYLIAAGLVIAVAVLGLVFYLIRRRTGFWRHRPPQDRGGGDEQP